MLIICNTCISYNNHIDAMPQQPHLSSINFGMGMRGRIPNTLYLILHFDSYFLSLFSFSPFLRLTHTPFQYLNERPYDTTTLRLIFFFCLISFVFILDFLTLLSVSPTLPFSLFLLPLITAFHFPTTSSAFAAA